MQERYLYCFIFIKPLYPGLEGEIMRGKKADKKDLKDLIHSKWKVVSIAVIALFVLFVVIGIIKAYHFRQPFTQATQSQAAHAKGIAIKKLQSMGENTSNYEIRAAEKIRKFRMGGNSRSIMQVSFYSNKTTHVFLIDLESDEPILHSKTEIYKEIGNLKHRDCGKDDDGNECSNGFKNDYTKPRDNWRY